MNSELAIFVHNIFTSGHAAQGTPFYTQPPHLRKSIELSYYCYKCKETGFCIIETNIPFPRVNLVCTIAHVKSVQLHVSAPPTIDQEIWLCYLSISRNSLFLLAINLSYHLLLHEKPTRLWRTSQWRRKAVEIHVAGESKNIITSHQKLE